MYSRGIRESDAMINRSFVVQFWLKCWIICPLGVTRPIINTLRCSPKIFLPTPSTISQFAQTIASMSIYLQSDGWVQFFIKIFHVDTMVITEAEAAEGGSQNYLSLQPSKFLISNASHQNYPALPWKLPQKSKHQPGNGLKCDRAPLIITKYLDIRPSSTSVARSGRDWLVTSC